MGGSKGKVLLLIVLATLALLIGIPATVAIATGSPENFQYYIKALEYGLKGLAEYFRFVIELFKVAITTS